MYPTLEFPHTLNFEVTTLCNSDCRMCPRAVGIEAPRPAVMSLDDYARVIEECKGKSVGNIDFTPMHGEPLLDPHIVERVALGRTVTLHRVGFFTNGSLMTLELATALIEAGVSEVCFSVDGATKETYEYVRRGLDFEQVTENIHGFLQLKKQLGSRVTVRIHMTALTETRHEVEAFRKMWLAVEGVAYATWLPNDDRGGPTRALAVGDDSIEEACKQPFCAVFILADGTAVMCCADAYARHPLGNVFKDGVAAVWYSDAYENVRELHRTGRKREIELCSTCKTRY